MDASSDRLWPARLLGKLCLTRAKWAVRQASPVDPAARDRFTAARVLVSCESDRLSTLADATLGCMSGIGRRPVNPVEARARHNNLQRRATWLIGRTIDDLHDRSMSEDEYTLLGIAGIVRRALFEKHSLADLERSRQGLPPLEFRYRPAPVHPSSLPLGTQIRLPALGLFREPVEVGTLSEFRNAPVGASAGQAISVEGLVKHFAHVEGAVHVGYPGDDTEDALGTIFGFRSEGWRHGLGLLGDIGFVVAEGLAPLVAAARIALPSDSLSDSVTAAESAPPVHD